MKKSILITTGIFPPEIGGPASYGMTLARRLAPEHKVTVLSYSKRRLRSHDAKLPFKVVRIPQWLPMFVRHTVFLIRVLGLAGKHDIVFALNAVSAGLPAMIAARLRGKKFVVKIVGDHAWEIAIQRKKTAYLIGDFQKFGRTGWAGVLHRAQRWVCRRADTVIVPSEFLAGVVQGWGIAGEKIKVIYNGAYFEPSALTKEEARKKIGIVGNVILSIGRFVPWKGFRMLIKIMPQLGNINQFFRLVIVGDGPDKHALETMVRNMGLERKVHFAGVKSQKDLAVYLAAADMFVLNTAYEGFSHQILEAMVAGVPVITTAVGGNKEVITQGNNGLLVKYNDEFNLVEAIRTLWTMPDLREHFITEGKKTAEQFSVERMMNETVELIETI